MGHGLLNSEEERRQERGAARRRPLVLMVDDDRADRELYGTILCYNGFDVVLSRTGRDALTQAHRFAPDCVLLDLGLPGMSGLQVAEALRTDPDTEAVPVVALSGYSENTMGSRARAAGCDVYLEKPTEPVKVLKEIEGMVGRPPLSGVGDPPRILGPLD